MNFTLAYVAYTVLTPFVAYGVEAGLRYSDPAVVETRLKAAAADFSTALARASARAIIPFNRKVEWGKDGRIAQGAPTYSPFIRRKAHLDLD